MSTMQGEVFEAFRALDIPEDKALRAAEALSRQGGEIAEIRRDLAVLKWMVGTLYPLVVAVLLKQFIH